MKEFILSFTNTPLIFIYIYFFSLFFLKRKSIFKKIILINSCLFLFFSLPITSYLFKLPLYPKKYIYEDNVNKKYSLILVPTSGFKKENDVLQNYPSNASLKRLENALNVFKYLDIPIFISGGKTINNFNSEAETLINNVPVKLDNKSIILDNISIMQLLSFL